MNAHKLLKISTLGLLISALVACGGGGGSSTASSTPTGPVTLSGKVIDGYISGAIVCLDVNSNNKCDKDEPTTTSLAGGAYILPPYTGSIAGLRVIAEVGENAIDEDDGQKVGAGNTYSLLAPAAASATVTPLSTMVSATIAAGGGEAQVSIGEALSNVAAKTGIAVEKLVANDYKEKNDVATAQVATVTAKAIAAVTNQISADPKIQAAGLSAGEITKAAINTVQASVLPQLIADGKATNAAVNNAQAAATAAVENANIAGKVQNIIVATKSGNGSVVQLKDIFEEGIVIAQESSGDYIDSNGKRVDGYHRGYTDGLNVEFLRTKDGKLPPYKQLVYLQDKWFDRYESSSDWTFNGTGWERMPGQGEAVPESLQPTYSENCVLIPANKARTLNSRYCAVQKDLSNRKIAEFIPGYCEGNPKKLSTCEAATFPAGSFAYDLTESTESTLSGPYPGRFQLWVSNSDWKGYCTKDNAQDCVSSDATIFDFINWTTVRADNKFNHQYIGDSCNTPFRIASYNSSTRKGVINWSYNSKGCTNEADPSKFEVLETSQFEVINLGGKDILITPTPATLRANNPSDNEPYRIFATHENENGVKGVWSGAYQPVNFKNSIPFTGDIKLNSQIMNKTSFDAIIKQVGYTPFPYESASSSGTYRK
jgi:hypothetical protein